MIFIKSIFFCFTIWVLTALLNALLSGTFLCVFSNAFRHWPETFFEVFICTLFFSVPGIFILWILLLANWHQQQLFGLLLKASLIISALSSLLLGVFPFSLIKGQQLFLSLCIVSASIASIMMHHSIIKSISANKIENDA